MAFVSEREKVLAEVPAEDSAYVGLYANRLMNTVGGRPSDCARRALAKYHELGSDAFKHFFMADKIDALRACPCSTCQADAAKLEAV